MKLNIYHELPPTFCETNIADFHELLGGPSLICLEGENKTSRPLFISTLLHGNEYSGVMVLQKMFKNLLENNQRPKRPIILFIGNTLAAKENVRHLKTQEDFNRVWSGGDCELALIASEVLKFVAQKNLYCSVDIHNNSGKNPFYSCINSTDSKVVGLARLFSEKIVYFTDPCEVQSIAFSRICPSITIEAGVSGEVEGINILTEKLRRLIESDELPDFDSSMETTVYHSIARMKFSENSTIDFSQDLKSPNDFSLREDIDEFNFKEFKEGELLGLVKPTGRFFVECMQDGKLFDHYFEVKDNKLLVKTSFIPAMLSKNITIIKDDCFGYIMEILGPEKLS
jgi:succinylglutamate desuccinylase